MTPALSKPYNRSIVYWWKLKRRWDKGRSGKCLALCGTVWSRAAAVHCRQALACAAAAKGAELSEAEQWEAGVAAVAAAGDPDAAARWSRSPGPARACRDRVCSDGRYCSLGDAGGPVRKLLTSGPRVQSMRGCSRSNGPLLHHHARALPGGPHGIPGHGGVGRRRLRGEPNNRYRLARVLEVLLAARRPLAELDHDRAGPPDYDVRRFFLARPREQLYRHIDARCERIAADGLLQARRAAPALTGLAAASAPRCSERRLNGPFDVCLCFQQ